MRRVTIFVLACLFSAVPMTAQPDVWTLDKSHSEITFSISHMAISEVTGEFNDYEIVFSSSKEDFTDAKVQTVINVSSIDTDNERRDNHLKSDDFFSAAKFPTISFASTTFEKVGDNSYKITGDLTLRDVTRTVTFDARHRGTIESQNGKRSGWIATLTIDRFDYNLTWDRVIETGNLVAGRAVEITLKLELRKQASS